MLPYIVRQNFSKKITLLNNRVKRGEIANTALFLMVLKIKQNMGGLRLWLRLWLWLALLKWIS
jgi:hypothetical protein